MSVRRYATKVHMALHELAKFVYVVQSALCQDWVHETPSREVKRFLHVFQCANYTADNVQPPRAEENRRGSCQNLRALREPDSLYLYSAEFKKSSSFDDLPP